MWNFVLTHSQKFKTFHQQEIGVKLVEDDDNSDGATEKLLSRYNTSELQPVMSLRNSSWYKAYNFATLNVRPVLRINKNYVNVLFGVIFIIHLS